MYLDKFLTDYDDSLGGDLNVDPLGMQVIWSAFGQRIFQNRVSSISNDVRNYTLNLFHHCVLKSLIEDESIVLNRALQKTYASKNELNFKHAVLIYLENLCVYSVVAHDNDRELVSMGVLGISKARRSWEETGHNPRLLFSHDKKAQVLVRQTLLGVSGRYKTPLVEMKFFDRHYHYSNPTSAPLWAKVSQLVAQTPVLQKLQRLLLLHLTQLLSDGGRQPECAFDDVPPEVTKAYVKAFASPASVGGYARKFWLEVTELDQGAAGALYNALIPTAGNGSISKASVDIVFATALRTDLPLSEKTKLEHIQLLEPFLAEVDLLFTLMMSAKSRPLTEIEQRWNAFGRNAATLAEAAAPVLENAALLMVLAERSRTGRERLQRLLALASAGSVQEQMHRLLDYHGSVMESRGQLPWLKLDENAALKLDVRPRREPAVADRPRGHWVNQYYLPQFRNLLTGLWGLAA